MYHCLLSVATSLLCLEFIYKWLSLWFFKLFACVLKSFEKPWSEQLAGVFSYILKLQLVPLLYFAKSETIVSPLCNFVDYYFHQLVELFSDSLKEKYNAHTSYDESVTGGNWWAEDRWSWCREHLDTYRVLYGLKRWSPSWRSPALLLKQSAALMSCRSRSQCVFTRGDRGWRDRHRGWWCRDRVWCWKHKFSAEMSRLLRGLLMVFWVVGDGVAVS